MLMYIILEGNFKNLWKILKGKKAILAFQKIH
jgi:hypothetical protein